MADSDGYAKYRRMLKMGVPRIQVDTSMRMDGKDPKAFREQDPNEANSSSKDHDVDLQLKGDQYDKYRTLQWFSMSVCIPLRLLRATNHQTGKMLKCGLPMGAVTQKMVADGLDPKGFTAEPTASLNEPAVSSSEPTEKPNEDVAVQASGPESGGGFLSELRARAVSKSVTPLKSTPLPIKNTPSQLKTPSPAPSSGGSLFGELKIMTSTRSEPNSPCTPIRLSIKSEPHSPATPGTYGRNAAGFNKVSSATPLASEPNSPSTPIRTPIPFKMSSPVGFKTPMMEKSSTPESTNKPDLPIEKVDAEAGDLVTMQVDRVVAIQAVQAPDVPAIKPTKSIIHSVSIRPEPAATLSSTSSTKPLTSPVLPPGKFPFVGGKSTKFLGALSPFESMLMSSILSTNDVAAEPTPAPATTTMEGVVKSPMEAFVAVFMPEPTKALVETDKPHSIEDVLKPFVAVKPNKPVVSVASAASIGPTASKAAWTKPGQSISTLRRSTSNEAATAHVAAMVASSTVSAKCAPLQPSKKADFPDVKNAQKTAPAWMVIENATSIFKMDAPVSSTGKKPQAETMPMVAGGGYVTPVKPVAKNNPLTWSPSSTVSTASSDSALKVGKLNQTTQRKHVATIAAPADAAVGNLPSGFRTRFAWE